MTDRPHKYCPVCERQVPTVRVYVQSDITWVLENACLSALVIGLGYFGYLVMKNWDSFSQALAI